MSKGLRVLIALLCIMSFGVCGFAVYKVFDTGGFSRESGSTAEVQETPLPGEATIAPSDSVQQATSTDTMSQSAGQTMSWEEGEPYYSRKYIKTNEYYTVNILYYSVSITNTGSIDLYLPDPSADLIGSDGKVKQSNLAALHTAMVLCPGETAWYSAFAPDAAEDDTIELHFKVFPSNYPNVKLPVNNVSFDYENDQISGQVENNTDIDFNTVILVLVVFFNEKGQAIGMQGGPVHGNLAPGESTEFHFDLYSQDSNLTNEPYSRYEIFAYPNYGIFTS